MPKNGFFDAPTLSSETSILRPTLKISGLKSERLFYTAGHLAPKRTKHNKTEFPPSLRLFSELSEILSVLAEWSEASEKPVPLKSVIQETWVRLPARRKVTPNNLRRRLGFNTAGLPCPT